MRARTRHALTAATIAAATIGAASWWVAGTVSHIPPSGDAEQWTQCTADTIAQYPEPPACLLDAGTIPPITIERSTRP